VGGVEDVVEDGGGVLVTWQEQAEEIRDEDVWHCNATSVLVVPG